MPVVSTDQWTPPPSEGQSSILPAVDITLSGLTALAAAGGIDRGRRYVLSDDPAAVLVGSGTSTVVGLSGALSMPSWLFQGQLPASGGGSASAGIYPSVGYAEVAIPAGKTLATITLIAGAGGGGSGARQAAGVVRTGGGSGAGGMAWERTVPVAALGSAGTVIPIYVGSGGLGGASVATDTTSGKAGNNGQIAGIGTMLIAAVATPPTQAAMNGIAASSSKLVAAGTLGQIWESTNGADWAQKTSPVGTGVNFICVAYAASIDTFVAVGSAGNIAYSVAGGAWASATSSTANQLNSIIWDGSNFVAVGNSGTIVTSANGSSGWAINSYSSAFNISQVAHDGGSVYAAVDSSGNVINASTATGTWTATQVLAVGQSAGSIAYGAGIWVIGSGSNGYTYTSSTGNSGWISRGPRLQRSGSPMTYVAGSIPNDVFGGMVGMFINERDYSFNGLNWYRIAHSGPNPCRHAVIFGGFLYTSTAGVGFFINTIRRLCTAFIPLHVMGGYGGSGGSTGSAAGGTIDGTSNFPAGLGMASVVSGSPVTGGNVPGGAGGGAGGGATAANAAIAAGIGVEGSTAPHYLLQGFQGVTGICGPNPGGSGGESYLMLGSSGGGGGAWNAGAAGQTGGAGGNPGGGGGGGSASDNGFASGAGGAGGNAQVRIIWM